MNVRNKEIGVGHTCLPSCRIYCYLSSDSKFSWRSKHRRFDSLYHRIPDPARVYCDHEYLL